MNLLANKNISLRALEPEDLEIMYRWENDTGLWHLSNTLVPYSRYLLKEYLEHSRKDIFELKQLRLIIETNGEGRAVGAIDLFDFDPFHRRAGVGILIAEKSDRKKGYAREALETLKDYAFRVLNLHQLFCNIGSGNQDSINLFKAAGFRVAGEKKEWLFTGKGYEDEWLLQCINPAHNAPSS